MNTKTKNNKNQNRRRQEVSVIPRLLGSPQVKFRDYTAFNASTCSSTLVWYSPIADLCNYQGSTNNAIIGNQLYCTAIRFDFYYIYAPPSVVLAPSSNQFAVRAIVVDPENYTQSAGATASVYPNDLVTPVDYQMGKVLHDSIKVVGTPMAPSALGYAGLSIAPLVVPMHFVININKVITSDPGTNVPQRNGVGFMFYCPITSTSSSIKVYGNIRTFYTSY